MNRDTITDAVLKGFSKANKTYEDWSRGLWVGDAGIEGFVVGSIAHEIMAACKNETRPWSLTMETAFSEVRDLANGLSVCGRTPKIEKGKPRVDMALYNANNEAVTVIEVKRYWRKAECCKDIERLKSLLKRYGKNNGGKLKFGIFTLQMTIASTIRKSFDEQQSVIEESVRSILGPKLFKQTKFIKGRNQKLSEKYSDDYKEYGEDWVACPLVVMIPG